MTNATCLLLVREAPGTLARPSAEGTQLLRLYHLLLPEQWVCTCLPSTRLQSGKLGSSYFHSFQDFSPLNHSLGSNPHSGAPWWGLILFNQFQVSAKCLFPAEGTVNSNPGGTSPRAKIKDHAMVKYLKATVAAPGIFP